MKARTAGSLAMMGLAASISGCFLLAPTLFPAPGGAKTQALKTPTPRGTIERKTPAPT